MSGSLADVMRRAQESAGVHVEPPEPAVWSGEPCVDCGGRAVMPTGRCVRCEQTALSANLDSRTGAELVERWFKVYGAGGS